MARRTYPGWKLFLEAAPPTEITEAQAAWLNSLPDASITVTGYFDPSPEMLAWFEAELERLAEAARVQEGHDRPDVEGS